MTDETQGKTPTITEQPKAAEGIQQQGIQAANLESQSKTDQLEASAPAPMKIEGMAKASEPAAPVAAPVNQIAPVSTSQSGTTSARESPKLDVPSNAQVSSAGATVSSGTDNPPAPIPSAAPAPAPEAVQPPQPPEEDIKEFGKPMRNLVREEPEDPLTAAKRFMGEIPGKMRLY